MSDLPKDCARVPDGHVVLASRVGDHVMAVEMEVTDEDLRLSLADFMNRLMTPACAHLLRNLQMERLSVLAKD